MLEQGTDPEEGHESEGGLCWSDSLVGGSQPTLVIHAIWRSSWRVISHGRDTRLDAMGLCRYQVFSSLGTSITV